jgi:hypothetical protein
MPFGRHRCTRTKVAREGLSVGSVCWDRAKCSPKCCPSAMVASSILRKSLISLVPGERFDRGRSLTTVRGTASRQLMTSIHRHGSIAPTASSLIARSAAKGRHGASSLRKSYDVGFLRWLSHNRATLMMTLNRVPRAMLSRCLAGALLLAGSALWKPADAQYGGFGFPSFGNPWFGQPAPPRWAPRQRDLLRYRQPRRARVARARADDAAVSA